MSAARKGPLRSAATEATMTMVAVMAAFSARAYQKNGSASIARTSAELRTSELDLDGRTAPERLIDDAIALGKLEQLFELILRRVGVDLEAQANRGKSDRRLLGHSERTAEVEIALGRDRGGLERNLQRGRDRLEGDARTGDQRLEQHVAGTKLEPRTAGRGMQACDRERAPGLYFAGDMRVIERALRLQGDESGFRVALVALLERRLHGAQRGGIHCNSPFRPAEDRRQAREKSKLRRHHHKPPPAAARVSPSSTVGAPRSRERSSAASTRRLTKSKAADCRSRGRGRSHPPRACVVPASGTPPSRSRHCRPRATKGAAEAPGKRCRSARAAR